MSSVIITPNAQKGLERCREFLANVAPGSEQKAFQVISDQVLILAFRHQKEVGY